MQPNFINLANIPRNISTYIGIDHVGTKTTTFDVTVTLDLPSLLPSLVLEEKTQDKPTSPSLS